MNLRIDHITAFRDDSLILDDTSLIVNAGEVVGIVGRNGAGKSTLLDCIEGTLHLAEGTIVGGSIARLEQDILLNAENLSIAQWSRGLETWQITYIIDLAGLRSSDGPVITPQTSIATLSGGQRTRLGLARLVTPWSRPDFLLLDEPTNTLDYGGIDWLVDIVRNFRGGIILVSHDRTLLNRICTHIAIVEDTKLYHYVGNYDDFRASRSIEHRHVKELYEATRSTKKLLEQQIITQHNNAAIGSGKHSSDSDKMARSFFKNRVGRRSGRTLQSLKSKLRQIEDVKAPKKIVNYRSSLSGDVPPHKLILSVQDLSFSYGEQDILTDINFELRGLKDVMSVERTGLANQHC